MTVFLDFIYRFQPPKMLTSSAMQRVRAGRYVFSDSKLPVTSFLQTGHTPWRFVLIVIASALAYTDCEMELTRMCCFEFNRKRGPDGKRLFLRTFRLYFRLAGFTNLMPLPEVDKGSEVLLSLTTLHVRDNSSHSQMKRSRSKVSLPLMSMGRKLLLFFTLILQIVNKGAVNFKCMGKMHNDLKIICLLTVWSWYLRSNKHCKK